MIGITSDMSEEEMRARAEAATAGQLHILQAAVEALIAVSPKPDFIQFRLAQILAGIQNNKEENPSLQWVPGAISAGATPLAERFIAACQANLATDR